MRISLLTKAIIGVCLFISFMSALGYYLNRSELKEYQLQSAKSELESIAHFLSLEIDHNYGIKDSRGLQQLIDKISAYNNSIYEISVLDINGKITASSDESEIHKVSDNHRILDTIRKRDHYLELDLTGDIWKCIAVVPIPHIHGQESNPKGYLVMTSTLEDRRLLIDAFMEKHLLSFFLILIGMLAFSIWISTRNIIKPIRDLSRAIINVSAGEFSPLPEIQPQDEIGDLIRSFNVMIEELSHTREKLEGYNQSLEQKVKEEAEKLKMAAQQLHQTEKLSALGQLIAGVAHELNNPLAIIMGNAQLLLAMDPEEDLKRRISVIYRSAERSQKIVQNLLSFARQSPSRKTCIKINDIISDCLELKTYDYKSNKIEIVSEFEQYLPSTMGDYHQLQQVFINILDNAQHALANNPGDKIMKVTSESVGKTIFIRFIDNGPGIPREIASRIFEPFYTTKELGKGTGLGLSIAYGIIEKHGGRFYVESHQSDGSTFVIELPIVSGPSSVSDDDDSGHAADFPGQKKSKKADKRILAVDDESAILDMITNLLERDGYIVDTAKNGKLALDKIQTRDYDVILCDMKMPLMNGEQLYDVLTEKKPSAAQRMVFVTGDIVNPLTRDFLRKSGRMFLQKPFKMESLTKVINDLIVSREFIAPVAPTAFLEKPI